VESRPPTESPRERNIGRLTDNNHELLHSSRRGRGLCQLRQARERNHQAQELHGMPPRKIGVDCQRAHRKQHKKACKQRAAELKDEKLYSQGHERPEGDFCPICTLPIPLPVDDYSGFNLCCTKRVCNGCVVSAQDRGMNDCPFCRTPLVEENDPALDMLQKRVNAKDPDALKFLGDEYFRGQDGLERNINRAIELWTEAAELGSIDAQYNLGNRYYRGEGVAQDISKTIHHWEIAAMKGSALARHNLGALEDQNGNYERAARHYLITAKMGIKVSLENVKAMSVEGVATKEQYTEALKGYQESVDEMKSPERDEVMAKAFIY